MTATADTVSRAQGVLAAGMALMTLDSEAAEAALSARWAFSPATSSPIDWLKQPSALLA